MHTFCLNVRKKSCLALAMGLLVILVTLAPMAAEAGPAAKEAASPFAGFEFRLVGPSRGGRSAAVTGVPGQPMAYLFGGTGGGVWRTDTGGDHWRNISDGSYGGSIGAVAVSEWDPNVIYVGGGEETVRGNVSHGNGMWKSLDGGKTWQHIGLDDTRHITRIRIHPRNPDLVYAAALGHLYGPNDQRGVFRSRDGGKTWEKVLFVNNEVGAVDLVMDPHNARVLYASTWRVKRSPWNLSSGGPGSGLWKSTDGGDTWHELTGKPGLPKGTIGIIGITVSPARPDRVWAIVEAKEGGVFRSDDGGDTWHKLNSDRSLRQRAWYYSRIYADPRNPDTVYVLNVRFWKSTDGGRTFESIRTPHGDHHDLWIAPDNPRRMIIGDDGGAQVTVDGGETWTTYYNQPTAQFYRVTTDNQFPYWIYGAQQDNSAVRISHLSYGGRLGDPSWEPTAGGESGWIAPDPTNADIVYGGSYGGMVMRLNHRTGEVRLVDPWPDNPMGHAAADLKYRFQWNFPLFFSPNNPQVLYAAADVLFRTRDGGQSWTAISPDLTRDDKSKMQASGGPITKDNTSVEYYGTIFTAAEVPGHPDIIWAGSDDGLIHVTRNGGKSWQNVTPSDLPEWTRINSIEVDPFHEGGLYVAATRYELDDFHPYLYKTEDFGQSWRRIDSGIPAGHFTRVVRADPQRQGLLFAGTEEGLYISFDDGGHWLPFQLNLPIVPITDLTIKDNDLIVATQGRAFWILDDISPLHQIEGPDISREVMLFAPRPSTRMAGFGGGGSGSLNQRPPVGAIITFYLKKDPHPQQPEAKADTAAPATDAGSGETAAGKKGEHPPEIRLDILDADGQIIRSFRTGADHPSAGLKVRKGFNRFLWDLRTEPAQGFPGMILWNRNLNGPRVVPGRFQVRLTIGDKSMDVPLAIELDPRVRTPRPDLQAQFDFLKQIRDKLTIIHQDIRNIIKIRKRLETVIQPIRKDDRYTDVVKMARAIIDKLDKIEKTLYQTDNRSPQDPLNFPIRLDDKLAGLMSVAGAGDYPPTEQDRTVRAQLFAAAAAQLAALKEILDKDVPAFNRLVIQRQVPPVELSRKEEKEEKK